LSILAYHMVDNRFDLGVTRVKPAQFHRQVESALQEGFLFQTISEYLFAGNEHPKRVALTFDDGYESVYTYAYPILTRYNLPATVFVSPNFMGKLNTWDVNLGGLKFRHMNWEQLKEVTTAGWEAGSHTMNHRDLTRLSPESRKKELLESRDILNANVHNFKYIVAYPFGNSNAQVVQDCLELGYRAGLIMGASRSKMPDVFATPRIGMYLWDTLVSFRHKLYGRNMWFYNTLQDAINVCSDCTVLIKKSSWT